jgi:hypothetical protein
MQDERKPGKSIRAREQSARVMAEIHRQDFAELRDGFEKRLAQLKETQARLRALQWAVARDASGTPRQTGGDRGSKWCSGARGWTSRSGPRCRLSNDAVVSVPAHAWPPTGILRLLLRGLGRPRVCGLPHTDNVRDQLSSIPSSSHRPNAHGGEVPACSLS